MPRKPINFHELRAQIERNGPTRVVVNADGLAVPADEALLEYGLVPDVVFIRHDGWSLGAPCQFRDLAFRLWEDDWVETIEFDLEREAEGN